MDPMPIQARGADDDLALDLIYGDYPTLFTIHMNHGGYFTNSPGRMYVNEDIDFFDLLDSDKFGYAQLETIRNKLDVEKLLAFVRDGHRYLNVYLENGASNVQRFSQSQSSTVLSICWHENDNEAKEVGESSGTKAFDEAKDADLEYHVTDAEVVSDNDSKVVSDNDAKELSDKDMSEKEDKDYEEETSDENTEDEDNSDDDSDFLIDEASDENTEDEDNSDDDSDFLIDEKNVMDDDEVDMKDFKFMVDEEVDDKKVEFDTVVDVLDNDNVDS
ncbi:acidic repeat-containing protein-like [Helianthus annuus]|uniref:acidic repeat-containing protein-like n=1 Tax=Helianthus annuus TaxID=4232 RepID=UPI000B9021D7|nr:acidic repeat-containing protein-like [Helianthus annuus]